MRLIARPSERIRREAADWKVRLGESAGGDVRADFERWREADPRHAEAYRRMNAIWSGVADLSAAPVPKVRSGGAKRGIAGPRLALAASLLLIAALVSVLLISRDRAARPPVEQMLAYATAVGEIREVRLPDGSRLILDSSSRVEADFTEAERRLVLLEGRARFDVAHEGRPFVVRAGSSQVVATGTLFDVSLIGGGLAVLLIEGSVQVRSDAGARAEPERLKPGQKLIVATSGPPVRVSAERGETLWPNRMLEFDDIPLRDAVELANRYSRAQLVLGDRRIGSLRVTGAYRAGDIEGFARSLAAAFDLRVETQPNGNLLLVDTNRPAPL